MFDLFVSYARKDNRPEAPGQPGWIDAFLKELNRTYRSFAARDLQLFFDKEDIRVMDDWRYRILASLRESNLLLAFLSPNYFASDNCRWEWEEYTKHEAARAVGKGEGIAPVYFVEVPGFENGATEETIATWVEDLRRRHHIDVRPF